MGYCQTTQGNRLAKGGGGDGNKRTMVLVIHFNLRAFLRIWCHLKALWSLIFWWSLLEHGFYPVLFYGRTRSTWLSILSISSLYSESTVGFWSFFRYHPLPLLLLVSAFQCFILKIFLLFPASGSLERMFLCWAYTKLQHQISSWTLSW